jgi:disulfide oxidoreductase YuzD
VEEIMNNKVKIEIFGIKNQPANGGCCSCSGNCRPVQTIGEQYEELIQFLKEKNLSDKVDIKFIEINKENLKEYVEINKLLEEEYYLPLTLVSGSLKLYALISNELIYDEIKKSLA